MRLFLFLPLFQEPRQSPLRDKKAIAMNSPSSITDVVPANFLCDNQTMEKIAESLLKDETALSSLDESLPGLESRRQCLQDQLAVVERLISDAVAEQTRLRSSIAPINPSLPTPQSALSQGKS
ncbi:hypothetical protein CPB85DRAFT_1252477 [Mucidula mucida]|nr:hypothetical protein CPB85DRAFT_1252477 [Mucidula mucida]